MFARAMLRQVRARLSIDLNDVFRHALECVERVNVMKSRTTSDTAHSDPVGCEHAVTLVRECLIVERTLLSHW